MYPGGAHMGASLFLTSGLVATPRRQGPAGVGLSGQAPQGAGEGGFAGA